MKRYANEMQLTYDPSSHGLTGLAAKGDDCRVVAELGVRPNQRCAVHPVDCDGGVVRAHGC